VRIPGHEVLSELGRGGMGVVLLCQTQAGARVAVKVLLPGADTEGLLRFAREQRLQSALGLAEGFVPLLDAGTADGRPYLVMPYLAGGTLRDRLRRGPLPLDEALRVLRGVAAAMACAHAKGIVHRDLKPENILFDEAERPLVADLGLARHFRRDVPGASQSLHISAAGSLGGTVGYMAPEQIDDVSRAGPRADVFALGVMLYEALAGRRPFAGSGLGSFAKELQRGALEPLHAHRPDVPRHVEEAVTRCLAIDAAERPQDAGELWRALEAPRVRRRRARASRQLRAALAAGALLLLLGGGVAVGLARRSAAPSPPPEPLPPEPVPAPSPAELAREALAGVAERERVPDWPAVVERTSTAIERDPTCAEAFWRRAIALCALGRKRDGLADGERAVALAPGAAPAWHSRAYAKGSCDDLPGCIADESRALELDPTLANAWQNRGFAHQRVDDHVRAIADFDRALELEPRDCLTLFGRAQSHKMRGDLDAADRDLVRAIEIDPNVDYVRRARAALLAQRGDQAGALRELEHVKGLPR
jgi:tetratricopeptide (TPR) repeat protein